MFSICIMMSSSTSLEHKVTGVSSILLFVEGKAESPNVAGVLESILVSPILSISILCEIVLSDQSF